jgi:uncharacterized BrkB/YihY/UPF0761 family membrane protein
VSFTLVVRDRHGFSSLLPAPAQALEALNMISFAVITALFGDDLQPPARRAHRLARLWLEAVVTSLLFTIGTVRIGSFWARVYRLGLRGGGVLLIIVVCVYSAQLLLLGAEATKVYIKPRGTASSGGECGLPVTAEARAEDTSVSVSSCSVEWSD